MTDDTPRGAPTSRRTFLRAGLGAGLGAAAASALGMPAVHAAERVVRISMQRSSVLFTVLKVKGTLAERLAPLGFTPSWHLFTSVIEPMNAGAVDIHADVADAVPIFTQSAGAPLTFYARERGSPAAEAIIVPADSPIRTVADLKGRTVGVSRGSGSHYVLAAALKRAGLSFADIKPAYLQAPEGAAAFEKGSLDAWSIWDPFLAFAEAKRPVRTIADGSGLTSYHRYYLVNDGFVAAHPAVVAAVYEALVEAGRWVKANPEAAVALLAPIWGDLPPAVVAAANARRTYAVEPVERARLGEQQDIADVFLEAKLIPRRIDATAVTIWQPPAVKG
ncbi:aliphatic sulfonate ABC transporter substrate-binding protein [Methylobacterium dankookense]|uniref:Putative aliphatic sulfonates-binding protein n=1 Tax=Methylobacterium dankookense TaxID=560405 RepID=A0A564G6L7_9HYPH|nr:aliphatic sulfonate ABC transporter substrate-binding protein [Methylobacterium dankookense]GJD57566.1 Putative aliphatic sulfonates-binding protein [Methylobacterium dankookense]VUF15480.1 Putative aliphatic sulfonates-binding protein [Methylobacterium dankookense]